MHDQNAFTPGTTGVDGGFFGGRAPAAADSGYFAAPLPPAPTWPPSAPGYGPQPAAGGGAVPGGPAGAGGALASVPPFVAAAAAFMLLAGVAALWAGLAGLVVLHAVQAPLGGGSPADGFAWRGVCLLANGTANVYLAYLLVRGSELGRTLSSVVCGWWVLYWLYETSKASNAFAKLGSNPVGTMVGLGQVGTMATLGILLLSAWAAVTGLLPWMSSASRHFR